jgi:hypothetical protein
MHALAMLFTGHLIDSGIDQHRGYVAGRYRNGVLSDNWTDVTRCADGTFTAFVPVCECGWRGQPQKPDGSGIERCRREWSGEHVMRLSSPELPAAELV